MEAELLRIADERRAANEPKPAALPEDDLAEQTRAALDQTDQDVRQEAERLLEEAQAALRMQMARSAKIFSTSSEKSKSSLDSGQGSSLRSSP